MLTLLKHAYSTRLKSSKHAKMSATITHFKSRKIFMNKAEAYPSEAPSRDSTDRLLHCSTILDYDGSDIKRQTL